MSVVLQVIFITSFFVGKLTLPFYLFVYLTYYLPLETHLHPFKGSEVTSLAHQLWDTLQAEHGMQECHRAHDNCEYHIAAKGLVADSSQGITYHTTPNC